MQVLCPEQKFVQSECYNDYLRHLGLLQCIAATLRKDGANSTNLSIFRGPSGKPLEELERHFLLELMPHLQSAFQLRNRIQGLERNADTAADVLDHLQHGAFAA